MANVLILHIGLALILSGVESCFNTDSLRVIVPETIPTGSKITTVETSPDCDAKSTRFTLSDKSFTISSNGVIEAVADVEVDAGEGRTFSVRAQDSSGLESEMVVHLVHRNNRRVKRKSPTGFLKRSKRRWSPPPFNILENDNGPYPKEIERIVSDSEQNRNVYYTISGAGADQHPVGLFTLDTNTAMLTVHGPIDREEYPAFTLTTRVFDKNTKVETDDSLDIHIEIDDVNDNAPQFNNLQPFTVLEQSVVGTVVGLVDATDRDKRGSLHVKIKYTLLTGLDLFAINKDTGVITTVTNTLDREVKDKHLVIVKIQDMEGAVTGLSNTATATITVGDINDNPPTFTKVSYAVDVKENEKEKLILRIPIEDKDLINTPNWISKFVIAKGNDNENFRIDTDNKTNEGLLYVSKALDYEKNKNIKLEIRARNQAELIGTTAALLSIPVDVNVLNEDEGPAFSTPTLRIVVKENTPNGTVIGSYTAVDPETNSGDGLMYYKGNDPGSWISVDRNNGELKVTNTIDRESPFVVDGLYSIPMSVVDASSKTGTGTVILVVEDVNDNVPMLPTSERLLCEKEGELGSVLVVAEDNDQSPFSSPFRFSLPDSDDDATWSVIGFNDTAATLKHMKELPTGIYNVPLDITDLQGNGKTQTAKVRICQCANGVCLANQSSMSLGPLALLAMLLPLLLLLLLCLLLAFFCVTKRENMKLEDEADSGGILLKSNTEAPGEEVDSSLINVPTKAVETLVKGSVKGSAVNAGWIGNKSTSTMGGQSIHDNGMYTSDGVTSDMQNYYSSQYNQFGTQSVGGGQLMGTFNGASFDNRYLAQDTAFLHNWETNGRYLHQKLTYFGTDEDGRYADDIVHSYGFEGVGSAAGSVGCCSDIGDDDNLDFLNTLGPKFKTLGAVCNKT
ncbi:desmocollin 2-like protein [Sebastes fasciatus]|uniref:desmocollin 2-like protein n=1 Tax=Sebastes fasciatus TaxID=394691 RepID=UPI003D9EFD1B